MPGMTQNAPPLIIGFVTDLMLQTRIENAAQGFRFDWIEDVEQITERGETEMRQPAENLVGPGAKLLDRVSAARPVLLIFDLGNTKIPWREWLPLLKSAPATRRIPALGFGPHVDGETLKAARSAGAEQVVSRSNFMRTLPDLIERWAKHPDYVAIEAACKGNLSEVARHGLEQFNQGLYFQAHETLEEAWNEEEGVGRELYRAILQVAVAYLQIERGNYNGAVKMFWRVRQWIAPLPEVCRGVQIGRLRAQAEVVYDAVQALGPQHIGEFDRSLFQPVEYEK